MPGAMVPRSTEDKLFVSREGGIRITRSWWIEDRKVSWISCGRQSVVRQMNRRMEQRVRIRTYVQRLVVLPGFPLELLQLRVR